MIKRFQPKAKQFGFILKSTIILLGLLLLVVVVLFFLETKKEKAVQLREPYVVVELPEGLTRIELAERLGRELGWNPEDPDVFASIYSQMDWAAFNESLQTLLSEHHEWSEDEEAMFMTNSSSYFTPEYDALSGAYAPGTYTFSKSASFASVAASLISRAQETGGDDIEAYLSTRLDDEAVSSLGVFIEENINMLPDLVPLPPSDVVLEGAGRNTLLRFSTTYYNSGDGPLELQADPDTQGIVHDHERDVFQRIYTRDGTYRDELVGTFLWHQPHLHYHFADFITYELEAVSVEGPMPDLDGLLQKSTFCIRDMSHIEIELQNRPEDADYRVCGKERQGISVGWADTYFYTYPDQALSVGGLPKGTYRLTFVVNPENRFEEITHGNNVASVTFDLDVEAGELTILKQEPERIPDVTHVYVD